MKHPKTANISALIDALTEGNVEFIIVGGVAVVIHGAPVATFDLDIIHRQTEQNVDRLLGVLRKLQACHRMQALLGNIQVPTKAELMGNGQLNLSTSLGPLDPLCQLHDGRRFDDLLENSMMVDNNLNKIRVIDIPTLIEIKRTIDRPKDRNAVAELELLLSGATTIKS